MCGHDAVYLPEVDLAVRVNAGKHENHAGSASGKNVLPRPSLKQLADVAQIRDGFLRIPTESASQGNTILEAIIHLPHREVVAGHVYGTGA